MRKSQSASVFCVVVTHNPDISQLLLTIESVNSNSAIITLVDNGSVNQSEIVGHLPDLHLILNKRNLGIAKAQNQGIKFALSQGAELVWLADQDTVFPLNFLGCVYEEIEALKIAGHRVGAVGPVYVDLVSGRVQPFFGCRGSLQAFCVAGGVHEVGMLISSGMVITRDAFVEVGLMNDELFIDYVDFEWCFRAREKGFKCFGLGDVQINHRLGQSLTEFAGRLITVRPPDRIFFIVRNATFLFFYGWKLNFMFRCRSLWAALVYAIGLSFRLHDQRRLYLRALVEGFFKGATQRLGPRREIP